MISWNEEYYEQFHMILKETIREANTQIQNSEGLIKKEKNALAQEFCSYRNFYPSWRAQTSKFER